MWAGASDFRSFQWDRHRWNEKINTDYTSSHPGLIDENGQETEQLPSCYQVATVVGLIFNISEFEQHSSCQ